MAPTFSTTHFEADDFPQKEYLSLTRLSRTTYGKLFHTLLDALADSFAYLCTMMLRTSSYGGRGGTPLRLNPASGIGSQGSVLFDLASFPRTGLFTVSWLQLGYNMLLIRRKYS